MVEICEHRGPFGVSEVLGVEPGRSGAHAAALRQALARYAVLCLRMQRPLEDAELQWVAGLFGPIKDPVARARDGSAFRYAEARQIIDSGFVMTDALRAKLGDLSFGGLDDQRPGLFETFHCDDTYTAEPASATVLHARELPPSGGGPTLFIDMRAAYDLLDATTRQRIAALRVALCPQQRGCLPAAALGAWAGGRPRRSLPPAGARAPCRRHALPLPRSRPGQARRRHVGCRGTGAAPDAAGPCRSESAALPARLARSRCSRLGQRVGPAQGRRELRARRAAPVLALHDRGRAAGLGAPGG